MNVNVHRRGQRGATTDRDVARRAHTSTRSAHLVRNVSRGDRRRRAVTDTRTSPDVLLGTGTGFPLDQARAPPDVGSGSLDLVCFRLFLRVEMFSRIASAYCLKNILDVLRS